MAGRPGTDPEVELLHGEEDQAPRRSWWRHVLLVLLVVLAMAALLVGLARATRRVPREEASIILVIDVSGSMVADDVAPDRMTAARRAASDFVMSLPPKLHVALVSFGTEVRVLHAPTRDRGIVLRDIDDLAANGGTAMGDAIAQAVELARRDEAAPADRIPASVLLISDGANTLGTIQPLDAADQAARLEMPIFAVALGTAEGRALIPDGRGGSRLQDVPPDFETLAQLAGRTKGRLYRAPSAEELSRVYDDIGARVGYRKDSSRWPLVVGIGLLVVAAGLSLAWRKQLRTSSGARL